MVVGSGPARAGGRADRPAARARRLDLGARRASWAASWRSRRSRRASARCCASAPTRSRGWPSSAWRSTSVRRGHGGRRRRRAAGRRAASRPAPNRWCRRSPGSTRRTCTTLSCCCAARCRWRPGSAWWSSVAAPPAARPPSCLSQRGVRVTIVEMRGSIGRGIEAITRRPAGPGAAPRRRRDPHEGHRRRRSRPDAVRGRRRRGDRTDAADLVALAIGWRPTGGRSRCPAHGVEVHVLGDARIPADFVRADQRGRRRRAGRRTPASAPPTSRTCARPARRRRPRRAGHDRARGTIPFTDAERTGPAGSR